MLASRPARRLTLAALAAAAIAWAGLGLATDPAPETAEAAPIHVFAAASLKNVLEPAADAWEDLGGAPVVLSFAGTATLAKQIEQGAPADIFVSANADWVDYLAKAERIEPGSPRDLASNALVLIAPAAEAPTEPVSLSSAFDLPARLGDGRLAIALTSAVPAGQYGRAALESLGLWDEAAPRLAEMQNVRAALALVARAEAPLGLVYASDAVAEPRVRVVATVPASAHPAIRYLGARVAGARRDQVEAFLDWLSSDAAWQHFERQNFLPPDQAPRIADISG